MKKTHLFSSWRNPARGSIPRKSRTIIFIDNLMPISFKKLIAFSLPLCAYLRC